MKLFKKACAAVLTVGLCVGLAAPMTVGATPNPNVIPDEGMWVIDEITSSNEEDDYYRNADTTLNYIYDEQGNKLEERCVEKFLLKQDSNVDEDTDIDDDDYLTMYIIQKYNKYGEITESIQSYPYEPGMEQYMKCKFANGYLAYMCMKFTSAMGTNIREQINIYDDDYTKIMAQKESAYQKYTDEDTGKLIEKSARKYSEYCYDENDENYPGKAYIGVDESFNPESGTPSVVEQPKDISDFIAYRYCIDFNMVDTNSMINAFAEKEDSVVTKDASGKITHMEASNPERKYVYDYFVYDENGNMISVKMKTANRNQDTSASSDDEYGPMSGYIEIQFKWKFIAIENKTPEKDPSSNTGDDSEDILQPAAKVGDKLTVKDASYTVTKTGEVAYTTASKKASSVTVPDTVTVNGRTYQVTSIAANAFKNNSKLKSVTIGKNIKKIGKNAFYGCKNLKKIKIKTTKLTKKTVGKNAFAKINKKAKVKVPKKQLKAYKKLLKARGIKAKSQKVTK